MTKIDAIVATPEDDTFSFLTAKGSAFTGVAGQLRWYAGDAGNLIAEGDINGDSVADFQVDVRGSAILSAGDFAL